MRAYIPQVYRAVFAPGYQLVAVRCKGHGAYAGRVGAQHIMGPAGEFLVRYQQCIVYIGLERLPSVALVEAEGL